MSKGRIVYLGTPQLAVPTLERVVEEGYDVVGVVCQPDKTRGRDRKKPIPPPVKQKALELGLNVMQPEKVKEEAFLEELEALQADAFLVFAFGQILPRRLIDMPPLGTFNAHASLLPKLRGPAPINWAIINGDEQTGMTIQKVVFELDAGPVCLHLPITLDPRETAQTLGARLLPLASEGFVTVLERAFNGTLELIEQNHNEKTYAPMLKKEDGYLDFSRSAIELDRRIRGLTPWPGAVTSCGEEYIKIHDALPLEEHFDAEPGRLVKIRPDGLVLACGEGSLLVRELQRQGKKRMCAQAYLCGCSMELGTLFQAPAS